MNDKVVQTAIRQIVESGYELKKGDPGCSDQLWDGKWWEAIWGCNTLKVVCDKVTEMLCHAYEAGKADRAKLDIQGRDKSLRDLESSHHSGRCVDDALQDDDDGQPRIDRYDERIFGGL